MPFQPTPRSLRDDVMFELDEQYQEFRAIADMVHHALRRLSGANRLRVSAVSNLRQAQALEDATWDGQTERRMVAL